MLVRETPERVLLSIKVSFEAKARWVQTAEAAGLSITKTVEMAAAHWEANALRRLRPEDRQRYLDGTLNDDIVAFDGRNFRREPLDVPEQTTVLSVKITTEARDQLVRYATLRKEPLASILEKTLRRRPPPPEPDPKPALDPDFARCMEPMAEDA